jgi:nicotinate-nucleotide--dimethylbenzimidazole phosphoribosyltransferase
MTDDPLDGLPELIVDPDAEARQEALDRWDRLAKPAGALGRLEELGAWVAATQGRCPPRPLTDVRVVVVAGDHGVAASGVSAYPAAVTEAMVRTFVAGGAAVNVLARQVGASVQVLDLAVDADLSDLGPAVTGHKVRRGTGRIDEQDAMTRAECEQAFAAGRAVADAAVDAGAQLLVTGDMGIGNTTPAAVLTALLTSSEVVDVVGRGTGIDDQGWMRKAAVVRDAAYRGRARRGHMLDLLAAVGGPDIAAMTGLVVQAAVRRTPVVLDGVVSGAAALVAHRMAFRTVRWMVAGHRSTEPAHGIALDRLGLVPLVDARLRLGEGTGALVAVPMLQAAAALLAEMTLLSDVLAQAGIEATQPEPSAGERVDEGEGGAPGRRDSDDGLVRGAVDAGGVEEPVDEPGDAP